MEYTIKLSPETLSDITYFLVMGTGILFILLLFRGLGTLQERKRKRRG